MPNNPNSRFQNLRPRYDVAILGAGISGARLFHELNAQGYRVLLLDRGDFACGTSQASGMMIWGGLLYLKDLDFRTVWKLCADRNRWIAEMPEHVTAATLRYLPRKISSRNRHLVHAGMGLYWLIGSWKRKFPHPSHDFPERGLLKSGRFHPALAFEEAMLCHSDSRFVLEWILSSIRLSSAAFPHCEPSETHFDRSQGRWRIDLRDRLNGEERSVNATFIVNAAGVWTDAVNQSLGIDSPYRHELSKGVYISVRRPDPLDSTLIFDTGNHGDTLTISPWGPVALSGPTETRVTELVDGMKPTVEDVRYLLRQTNANLRTTYQADDVISLRCGIRPLAVRCGFSKIVHPLELSRRHLIHWDRARNGIAIYGGKLTSCRSMAEQVSRLISPSLPERERFTAGSWSVPPQEPFPGLEASVPSAAWCRDNEQCLTLEDYLRRRSNIAQWLPRRGLGNNSEHLDSIRKISRVLHPRATDAEIAISQYQQQVHEQHDALLAAV